MTREDAKYILSELMKSLNEYCGLNDTGFKAFNMAIKALEQESCEDVVSRKSVIEALNTQVDLLPYSWEQVKNAIEKLPSVTSKPKTGKWIQHDARFPWSHHYKCSECGNTIDMSGLNAGRGDANYCPNCGAKMECEK